MWVKKQGFGMIETPQVYLSSTLNDLQDERAAVRAALQHKCLVIESYSADERTVKESCLADVAKCDLYIGILGLRYGHCPDGGLSITELEFDEAVARKLPRLIFIKKGSIDQKWIDAVSKESPSERIEAFIKKVNTRAVEFSSAAELKFHVLKAYTDYFERQGGGNAVGALVRPHQPMPHTPEGMRREGAAPLVPEAVTETPMTEWSRWVADTRAGLAADFKRAQVFTRFDGVLERQSDGLPYALHEILASPTVPGVGELCVERVIELTKACHRLVRDGELALVESERVALREGFLSAMGRAARLSIDPAKLVSSGIDPTGKMTPRLEVPAFNAAGAGIALRTRPPGCWELGLEAGIPVLKDKHVEDVPVEMGEGVDTRSALARQAYLTLGDPRHAPDTLSESLYRTIKARAKSEARDGRARILLPRNPLPDETLADLQAWLEATLGVYLMVLRKPEDPSATLFSWDEDDLLARIASFLQLLDQPEWRCERRDS